MVNLKQRETIYRKIGILEGISWAVESNIAEALDLVITDLVKLVEEDTDDH